MRQTARLRAISFRAKESGSAPGLIPSSAADLARFAVELCNPRLLRPSLAANKNRGK